MTKISQLTDIGANLAANDEFLIRDVSDASTPNKKVTSSGFIDYVIAQGAVSGFTQIAAGAGPQSRVQCTTSGVIFTTAATERLHINNAGQVVSAGIGSAAAPIYSFATDSNTGVFSPGEDILALSTGGSEKWRIGGSGYGFGHLTNSTTSFDTYKPSLSFRRDTTGASGVDVSDSTALSADFWGGKTLTYGQVLANTHSYFPAVTNRALVGLFSSVTNNGSGDNLCPVGSGGTSYWTPNGVAIWAYGIGNSGNAGTASIRADAVPYYDSSVAFYARVNNAVTSGRGFGLHCDLGGHPFGASNIGVYVRQIDNQVMTGCAGFYYKRHNTAGTFNTLVNENGAGSYIGGITCTNTATAFATTSDYRLKENVIPLTDGIERLKQIPVHRFNFKESPDITQDGFLAHELELVVPEAVTGQKDEMRSLPKQNKDGTFVYEESGDNKIPVMESVPFYQAVDYSKVIPLLTAALNEAVVKIESLEARLTAAGL